MVKYPVITKPAKGEDGFCPPSVLKNETTTETCNTDPCSEFILLILYLPLLYVCLSH